MMMMMMMMMMGACKYTLYLLSVCGFDVCIPAVLINPLIIPAGRHASPSPIYHLAPDKPQPLNRVIHNSPSCAPPNNTWHN